MNLFLITIIESIYLYYMFHIFRTKYTFHHPFEYLINDGMGTYFEHPIGVIDNKRSKICKFGRDGSIMIIIYLYFRYIITKLGILNVQRWRFFNKLVLLLIFILSWMNLNAVIYFLPFILFDFKFIN
jgi:hypothetical protein